MDDNELETGVMEIEDEDDDYEEDEEKLEEMTSPRVSCWLSVDGKTQYGVMVIENNKCEFDNAFCPICFHLLSTHGKHRICCLPCGHIYGLSCIKKWLLQRAPFGDGKCPKCNKLYKVKDVILLYAGAHQKAASSSTRYYPFTRQGFTDFKNQELLRHDEAKKMLTDECKRLADVLEHKREVEIKQGALLRQWLDLLVKLEEKSVQPAYALKRQAKALKQRADALRPFCDELERRADVLKQRTDVLGRRYDAYLPSLNFFKEMYKEHSAQQKKKKTTTRKNTKS